MKTNMLFRVRCLRPLVMLSVWTLCQTSFACAQQSEAAHAARMFDEYGKVGHCDETARLDNFAITLQNEPESRGHVIVYAGKEDLPGSLPAIRNRARHYLVQMRGLEPARLEVVFGGFRETRATELWVLRTGDAAPSPSRTIEVARDPHKAIQYTFAPFDFEHTEPDEAVDESAAEEAEEAETADASTVGASANGETAEHAKSDAPGEDADSESEAESDESDFDPGEYETTAEDPESEASKVNLEWQAERYVEALKQERGARACLIVYYDPEGKSFKKVQERVEEVRRQLVERHGLKAEQIVTLAGGYHDWPQVEFWIVPEGAELPVPKIYEKETVREDAPAEEAAENSPPRP